MKIVRDRLQLDELRIMMEKSGFGMVKAVVDINKKLLAVDADLHSDLEGALIREGSSQYDLWGINLYPDAKAEDLIEYDSMINIRPVQGNRSREVEDALTRKKIAEVVGSLISG